MNWTVGELAKQFGVSVRTLRYYDERGLLPPTKTGENGYRYYDERAAETLSQILFYRTLDFPLESIPAILSSPQLDRVQSLRRHRELMLLRRGHLDELIKALDELIGGEQEMKKNEQKPGMDYEATRQKYAAEAKEKWGATPEYARSEELHAKRGKADNEAMMSDVEDIFRAFAAHMDLPADSEPVKALVRRWQNHITRYYYDCSDQMLACLGQMYVSDERFTRNIDQYGDGCARFMSEAIEKTVGEK